MQAVTAETESQVRSLVESLEDELARQTLEESLSVAIDDPDKDDGEAQTFAGIVADAIDILTPTDPFESKELKQAKLAAQKAIQRAARRPRRESK